MLEVIIDIVAVLAISVLYCTYHREELYGRIDDSQTRWDNGHQGIGDVDQGYHELPHP